ncbi:MAG TPA: methyl-accepting chemotaxis protein [Leptolyngbya sp.]|jgi:methyl-accepting chemotaxis protein|nr:methyl-accepting chemotaxis protein [Leptolyngbya sp.]
MVSDSTQNIPQSESASATTQMQKLLEAIQTATAGDFTVRLDENSVLGDVAREFNLLMGRNAAFAQSISEVSQQIAIEGKLEERLTLETASGTWATMAESTNRLICHLTTPIAQIEQITSAIAQGNFTETMPLEIDGTPLTGGWLRAATRINDLTNQLDLITTEISRVAKEIGVEGKLGSIATVPEASGIWQDLIENINQMSLEVTKQVHRISEIVLAVAQGDLINNIEAENIGEFGVLTGNVNQMIQNLQRSMRQMAEIATTVATASEELTAVSSEMTSNAGQTAEQATSASSSAEQVSRNAITVATAIEEMNVSIREIAKNAAEGAKVATDAVKTSDQTNITITKLGQSSIEIGKVIKVITSIAQQTNLLALNATIEAARAGDAGRGFAVVANEVKELAKQTAAATEEISQRIEAIQTDTKGAVDAITEIAIVINQINDIQNTIASAVEQQTATTNEIARNVSESAQGSSDIAKNISIVAENAQATTTGANNTSQASSELARMAVSLQNIVNTFQV